jgi:hypothetical protein
MKTKYITTALSIIFLSAILITSGCSSDDGGSNPTPLEAQLALLENNGGSWISTGGSVTKEGYDVSGEFSGFKLTVDGFNYTTENSLSGVWASSEPWSFKNDRVTTIERNDGVIINITSINNIGLVLTFTDPSGTGGRYSSIPGDYVFSLKSE